MSTPHVLLRGAEWVLRAERAEGAPEAVYQAECMVCPAVSGRVDNDPKPVAVWTINHTCQHGPAHCQFLVTTQKHWRVDRCCPGPAPAPRTPPAHARPTAPRRRWVAALLGRFR